MPEPRPTITEGPVKWLGVGALSVLGIAGLAWSIWMRSPIGPRPDPLPPLRADAPPDQEAGAAADPARESVAAGAAPAQPKKQASVLNGKLNINTATRAELELLPGIGPSLAQRIIDHRDQHGLFKAIDDLDDVKGIGPRTLEKLRPLIFVE